MTTGTTAAPTEAEAEAAKPTYPAASTPAVCGNPILCWPKRDPVGDVFTGVVQCVTGSGSAVVVAGQLILAGAVCPIVIGAAGHRAQVVVCG